MGGHERGLRPHQGDGLSQPANPSTPEDQNEQVKKRCLRIAHADVLGARFTLSKGANGDPDIAVELTITAAAAQPWFDDSMLAMLQAYRAPDASLFFDADEQKQRPLRVVESSLWRR